MTLTTREQIGWTAAIVGSALGVLVVGLKTHFSAIETLGALAGALTSLAGIWGVAHVVSPSK